MMRCAASTPSWPPPCEARGVSTWMQDISQQRGGHVAVNMTVTCHILMMCLCLSSPSCLADGRKSPSGSLSSEDQPDQESVTENKCLDTRLATRLATIVVVASNSQDLTMLIYRSLLVNKCVPAESRHLTW